MKRPTQLRGKVLRWTTPETEVLLRFLEPVGNRLLNSTDGRSLRKDAWVMEWITGPQAGEKCLISLDAVMSGDAGKAEILDGVNRKVSP